MTDQDNVFKKQEEQQKKLESLSKEVGFDIPLDLVALPSNGLVYTTDHPLSNCESVEYKAMTSQEEDILTSRALIKNGTVISTLIKNCLTNKLIDPDTLLVR